MEWKSAVLVVVALCATISVTSSSPLQTTNTLNSEFRLSQDVIPLEYKIELDPMLPSIDDPQHFNGKITIKVKVLKTTGMITMHALDLVITSRQVTRVEDDQVIQTGGMSVPGYHFYLISNYEGEFEEGKEYNINIEYRGYHGDNMYGFYRSSYKDENNVKKWLVTTQFQATSARRAFPCFDEPAFKATFEISIKKIPGLAAISNMNIQNEDDSWYHFAKTPKMSTYLIAFIVSDFGYKTDGILKVWSRKQAVDQTQYSVDVGLKIIRAIENFLMDYTYHLPKMDEVAVPDFSAGAMENWGICTYRERLILYDKSASSAEHKQRIAAVVSHEFGHQWFGDLVSPEWWNYLWLNEGFATYFESFATDKVETTWRMAEQFVVRDVHSALAADGLETTHPMTQDVDSPNSISSMFDAIAYEKAGSVIRMMEHFVTTDVFRRGLNKYLEARNHDYANEDHLFEAIDSEFIVSNNPLYENVKDVMYTWTRQAGFPLVTVTSSEASVEITQKRFLLGRLPRPRVDTIWTIPLTYVAQDGDFTDTRTKLWLKEASITIDRPSGTDKWYLFNIQEAGFYRVNYDAANWKLLIDYLNSNDYSKISPVNRAQLLDDSLILARAGELDYNTALGVTRYLKQETDYIPWYSGLNNLAYLRRRLTGTANFENFKNYMLNLIEDVYNELGFEDADDHSHVTKLHRSLILQWACELDHEHCVQTSKDKFTSLRTRNEAVPADLQSVVFCTAVRHGDRAEWEHLWNLYLSTNYATQQSLILSALGCTRNQELIDTFLHKSITVGGDIRRQDASSVFAAVYSTSEGVRLALDFLEREVEAIMNFYGTGVSSIISGIATRISTQELIDRLELFVSNTELGSATAAAQRAIETAKDNLFWMQHHEENIGNWLNNELNPGGTTGSPGGTTSAPGGSTGPSVTEPTTDDATSLVLHPFVCIIFIINIIYTYTKCQQ